MFAAFFALKYIPPVCIQYMTNGPFMKKPKGANHAKYHAASHIHGSMSTYNILPSSYADGRFVIHMLTSASYYKNEGIINSKQTLLLLILYK